MKPQQNCVIGKHDRPGDRIAKRALDVVAATTGLILLSPVLLIVAIVVSIDSRGGVLFRQQRIGRGFKPFALLKFRTMKLNSERLGASITASGDPRITRVGHFLRWMKLDELPQLINVIRGEMSLVGPRPEVPCYVERYRNDFQEILEVRPGITDFASIRYRDESTLLAAADDPEAEYVTRILPDKINLAREYVKRSSVWLDLVIIASTLLHVFAASGRSPRRSVADPLTSDEL